MQAQAIPNGVAISRTCARCAISSDWVWCGFDRRARQLELSARFQRNRAAR
jgi:hypothetical protein